eukprot:7662793-Pyramimonas_sp.AAC.1
MRADGAHLGHYFVVWGATLGVWQASGAVSEPYLGRLGASWGRFDTGVETRARQQYGDVRGQLPPSVHGANWWRKLCGATRGRPRAFSRLRYTCPQPNLRAVTTSLISF